MYKDVTARREYMRKYMRRRRAKQARAHPLSRWRIYFCQKTPDFRLPGISFRDHFAITSDPEAQRRIEQHARFGQDIFPLAVGIPLDLSPQTDEDE
jgi:hypothetical protein